MVITNLKKFESACKSMQKICDGKKAPCKRIWHDVFFMEGNKMTAIEGGYLVTRGMSDCVINDETFCFPCNVKPKRVVVDKIGDTLIIENKKEEFFDDDKKSVVDFNWKKIIPNKKIVKEQEYDFSDYKFTLKPNPKSRVRFNSDGSVEFRYNDDVELIGTYEDVVVKKDDFFEAKEPVELETVEFPMEQIYILFKFGNSHLIIQEYEGTDADWRIPRKIIMNGYEALLMPCTIDD